MERSSKSKHLQPLLGFVLLVAFVAGCAGAPKVIQLSPALLATSDELEVHLPFVKSGVIWRYKFGQFAVSSVDGSAWVVEHATTTGLLNQTTTSQRDEPFQYSMTGGDSTAVRVRGAISTGAAVDKPLTFSLGDDDGFGRDEDVREIVRTTTAHIVFEADSAAAWELRIVERYVPDGSTFDGTVTNGTRTVRVVPITSDGPVSSVPVFDMFGEHAHGFVLEEEGLPVAAVQYKGSGWGYLNAMKAWLPLVAPARERLEWAAILTALLASEHKKMM